MEKAKRLLSMLLALCLILGVVPSTALAGSLPFTDVKGTDWYYDAVQYVYENGIMNGTSSTEFSPDEATTRGMIVTVLHRMEGEPSAVPAAYADVAEGKYYTEAVAWAGANGIVNGYGDGTFGPNDTITREQLAAILYRYAQYLGQDVSGRGDLSQFSDRAAVSGYAEAAVSWAVRTGILSGVGRNTLSPQSGATRAQVATILMRFLTGETVPAGTDETSSDQNQAGNSGTQPGSGENNPPESSPVQYTVTFDSNGGSVVDSQKVEKGGTAVEPEAPTKMGFLFDGWYADPALENLYDFAAPVNGDITLYAKWQETDSAVTGSGSSVDVYAITGLTVDNGVATAIISAPENCALVVRFIDEDVYFSEGYPSNKTYIQDGELYASHAVRGGTDMEPVDATVNGTLPEFYVAESVLIDGEGQLLCDPFCSIEHTKRYQEFDAKTIHDFGDATVLNFDEDEGNNFGVLAEDVKSVDAASASVDEDGIYTVTGLGTPVAVGEKILLRTASQDYLFKVQSVETADGVTTITPVQADDAENGYYLSDFYEFLKVDMSVYVSEEEVSDEDAGAEENAADGDVSLMSIEDIHIDHSVKTSISFNPLTFETDHFKATGTISGSVKANLRIIYDLKLFGKDYFDFEFTTEYGIDLTVDVMAKWEDDDEPEKTQKELKFGKLTIPFYVTGLDAFATVKLLVSWEITAGLNFETHYNVKTGFSYNTNDGTEKIDKKSFTYALDVKGSVEIKVGPKPEAGVEFLNGVVSASVNCFMGGVASAEARVPLAEGGAERHACYLCISGEVKALVEPKFELKYEISNHLKGTPVSITIASYEKKLFDFYISLLNSDDSQFHGAPAAGRGSCPNKEYMTVFTVQDEDGAQIDGTVRVAQKDTGTVLATLSSGESAYLYDGNYVASTTIDGASVSKSFVVSGEAQNIILKKSTADGKLAGQVKSAEDNSAISGATVSVYKGSVDCGSTTSGSDGSFEISLAEGTYKIVISAPDYVTYTVAVTIRNGETEYMDAALMARDDDDALMGGVFGTITDAVTGQPVSGVSVKIISGANNSDDSPLVTTSTNSDGEYAHKMWTLFGVPFGLPAGNYTVKISKAGYVTTSFNIVIVGGENTEFSGTINPVGAEDEYRIVLRWGSTPRDLDSHLNGRTTSGVREHVFYSHKTGYVSNLDVDDTSSYGPETITVTSFSGLEDGFTYSVHDYTNRSSTNSTAMSESGAYVEVYLGSTYLRTFYIPTGKVGTVWNVFSVDGAGNITPLNTFENVSDPANVGAGFAAGTTSAAVSLLETAPLKDYELTD